MSKHDLDNPELYVELLHHSSRDDPRHPIDVDKTESCPEPLQLALEMDEGLQKSVRTLIGALANVIAKYHRNPPAVAARLTQQDQKQGLRVHIYFTFNDTTWDEYIFSNTSAHLSYLLDELRSAAQPVIQESPPPYKIDYRLLQTLSWRVHQFCLGTFIHRVQKGQNKFYLQATVNRLYEMRRDPENALGDKSVKDYLLMCTVLEEVEELVDTIDKRKAHLAKEQRADDLPLEEKPDALLTLQESNSLLVSYTSLTKHNLPDDHNPGDYKKLKALDAYLKETGLDTEFARWVPKVFKLFQSTAYLINLSYSKRLSRILTDLVKIMNYVVSNSPLPDDLLNDPTDFIDLVLLPRLTDLNNKRRRHFTIHAEIALVLHLQQHGLASSTYPFLGLSKLSCTACVELMRLINGNSQSPIWLTSGTHCKIYRSWVYPDSISNPEIKPMLAHRLQKLLFREFVDFARSQKIARRLSDNSIESQGITIHDVHGEHSENLEHMEARVMQRIEQETMKRLSH
ncbi:hypothetical protein E1B28_004998 [Marasmius oreades]|uniref:Uncharacterized protein n=1 Tax=Marasmius oreades TaxID=181124 RepID=A0A9P7UZU4_9AGAR|nr:uncharacterized protein E1B28_004998 [Marasmius oreades]KAG7097672.1 hypothetical protein E1B28_004998 [Marasmius oreades]